MTRIGIRAGHTERSCGSSGILNENKEAREVKKYVIEYLSKYADIIDLQPPEDMSYPQELNYGINKANSIDNMDLAFSIHFNNAYDNYDGAIGTETHIYPNSKAYGSAKGILDKLTSLGFKNRGVYQDGEKYGEPRCSNHPWIIIEVCFVEATEDAHIYNQLGAKVIAKAIVEGILGQEIQEETQQNTTVELTTNQMPTKPMWIRTREIPCAYNGYDGTLIDKYIHKYFNGIKVYVRGNSSGRVYLESEYIEDLNSLNEIANALNNDGLFEGVYE